MEAVRTPRSLQGTRTARSDGKNWCFDGGAKGARVHQPSRQTDGTIPCRRVVSEDIWVRDAEVACKYLMSRHLRRRSQCPWLAYRGSSPAFGPNVPRLQRDETKRNGNDHSNTADARRCRSSRSSTHVDAARAGVAENGPWRPQSSTRGQSPSPSTTQAACGSEDI